MTEADWLEIAEDVAEGIIEVGTVGYMVVPGATSGPEDNPVVAPPTEAPVRVMYSEWKAREIDGTLIRGSDIKMLVAAQGTEPEVDWKFRRTSGGKDLQVVPPLLRIAPAGTPVLFIVNLRK